MAKKPKQPIYQAPTNIDINSDGMTDTVLGRARADVLKRQLTKAKRSSLYTAMNHLNKHK